MILPSRALCHFAKDMTCAVSLQLMECSAEDDYVTSVAWAADGKHVSVGTSSAQVQVGSHILQLLPAASPMFSRVLLHESIYETSSLMAAHYDSALATPNLQRACLWEFTLPLPS